MRKIGILLILTLLFAGCRAADTDAPMETLPPLPENYTAKWAAMDGCLVRVDGEYLSDAGIWEGFVKEARKGIPCALRLVLQYGEDIYVEDLVFDGEKYTLSYLSEDAEPRSYKHLLELSGTMPNAARESRFVVLFDEADLDFDRVGKSLFSSQSDDWLDITIVLMD